MRRSKIHNKSFIIEFNGLPASGKTEIANYIVELGNFNYCNYKFYNEINKLYFKDSRILKVIRFSTLMLKPSSIKFSFITLGLLKEVGDINKSKLLRGYSLIMLYLTYQYIHKKTPSFNFIVDQGIIQQIISIAYLDKLNNMHSINKLLMHLNKTLENYSLIHTDIDVKKVCERMSDRKRNYSRIDHLDKTEIIPALKLQNDNFRKIRAVTNDIRFKSITMDTTKNPKINASNIVNWINKL